MKILTIFRIQVRSEIRNAILIDFHLFTVSEEPANA